MWVCLSKVRSLGESVYDHMFVPNCSRVWHPNGVLLEFLPIQLGISVGAFCSAFCQAKWRAGAADVEARHKPIEGHQFGLSRLD